MANELDELTGPVNGQGRDVNVIEKQIPVKTGVGSVIFEVILWILGIIPGVIFLFMKVKAGNYLSQLQQKIQHDASQIDNYLEQRVVILQNCARLLDKAIDLDKTTMTQIAAYRSGAAPGDDGARNPGGAAARRGGQEHQPRLRELPRPQGARGDRRRHAAERLSPEGDHGGARTLQRHRQRVEPRHLRMAHQYDRRLQARLYDPHPLSPPRRK